MARLFDELPDQASLEVLWVFNGCTDDSERVVRDLAARHRKTRHRLLHSPRGKGVALRTGLDGSSTDSDVVGWTDADGAIRWTELERLMAHAHENQYAVFGRRDSSERHPMRRLISKLSNRVARGLAATQLPSDVGCPAKFWPRSQTPVLFESGWTIDLEAGLRTRKFVELDVRSRDVEGSHYNFRSAVRHGLDGFRLLLMARHRG